MAKKSKKTESPLNSKPDPSDSVSETMYRINVETEDLIQRINEGNSWTGRQARRYTDLVWMRAMLVKP